MCKVLLNEELKGIELFFEDKPAPEVREEMKVNGFRWNGKKLCWYAKQTKKAIQLGEKLQGQKIEVMPATAITKKINSIDLWNLIQIDRNIKNDSSLANKEIAKEVRTYLKNRFPFVKFSIRTRSSGYTGSIDCDIISSPFEKGSCYLEAIQEYCKNYLNSYNWDDSDLMTDYYSVNFYGGYFEVDYDYIQTEAGEEIKKAIENFDIKKIEAEKIEIIEQERKYQECLIEREASQKAYELRLEQEKKDNEYINNNIEVVEIAEAQQYYILQAKFANLNKNQSIEQYQDEITKNDYELNNVKITRELHFKDAEALRLYNNSFLTDFDFIEGTGGSYTEDLRVNTMEDYSQMTDNEKKSIEWLLKGIAVYFNNELQYIIDAQGFSYARYVGLVDENTKTTKKYEYAQVLEVEEVQELREEADKVESVYNSVLEKNQSNNWYDIRKAVADELRKNKQLYVDKSVIQQVQNDKAKNDLYRVLQEVDTVEDQFNNVEFMDGEKLTIIRESMIAGASVAHVSYKGYEEVEEYNNKHSIKMTITQKGKKGLYTTSLGNDKVLIYKGHIEGLESVLYEPTNGGKVTKYGSYDSQAVDDILTVLQRKKVLPIINTFKPIF